jgi:TPR repeat protein
MILFDQGRKPPPMKNAILGFITALLLCWGLYTPAQTDDTVNAFYNGVTAYRAFEFDEAARWFLLAAEAGDVEAQFLLGRMHYDGNSLSVDNVTAYMWFDIAAHNGLPVGARYRDGIAERLSAEEILLAQQRSAEWRSAHPVVAR